MRLSALLVACLTAALICTPAWARERKSRTVDPAAKAKIAALQKELTAADAKMYAAFRKIEKVDKIVELRKAALAADRAYQKGKETDPDVLEAKSAIRKADREADAIVLKKLKALPTGSALLKERTTLDNKRAACSLRAALAEVKLTHEDSPIVRALEADPIIVQYKRAYYNASGDARDAARADYDKLRKATLADMSAARALIAEIKTAKAEEKAAEEAIDAVEDKIDDICGKLKKSDDPELKAARAREIAAREAYEKAYYGGKLKLLREKREETRQAVRAGIEKIIAADPSLSALSTEIRRLSSEIKNLGGKARRSSRR